MFRFCCLHFPRPLNVVCLALATAACLRSSWSRGRDRDALTHAIMSFDGNSWSPERCSFTITSDRGPGPSLISPPWDYYSWICIFLCVSGIVYVCTYDMLFVMFLHFLRKSIMKNALSSSAESLADFGLCHWVFMTILPCRQQPFSVYHNWIQNKVDIIIDYMQSLWLEPTLCICNAIHLVFRLSTIEIFIRFSFDIETL